VFFANNSQHLNFLEHLEVVLLDAIVEMMVTVIFISPYTQLVRLSST
jgi:hypothetical protein